MLELGESARFPDEVGKTPIEGGLVAVGFRPHAHGFVALAEIERKVLFDCNHGAELHILGFIGDPEPARANHADDAIAAIEECAHRQNFASIQRLTSLQAVWVYQELPEA
jgi:hypothetical protein